MHLFCLASNVHHSTCVELLFVAYDVDDLFVIMDLYSDDSDHSDPMNWINLRYRA